MLQINGHDGQDGNGFPAGVLVASLFCITWGYRLWGSGLRYPASVWLGVLLILYGVAAGLFAWTFPRYRSAQEIGALVLSCLGFIWWIYIQIHVAPGYHADELAFDQYAAHFLLKGIDPYTQNMGLSFRRYLVPPTYYTYTLTGQPVVSLSYPALSFLLYVPVMLLGVHLNAGLYVDAVFWVAMVVVLWLLLPRRYRWFAFIFLAMMMYVSSVYGGVTDSLFLPFLLLAVWRWDRYGVAEEKSVARWIGPVMLGVAMSIKQLAWFMAPFLLAGIILESLRRGECWWRNAVRYVIATAIPFLVFNVAFIVWDPKAWLNGVLHPLITNMVPLGQGLIALWLYCGLGNGELAYLKLLGAVVLLLALAVFIGYYPNLKRNWIALIPLVFFWTERSLFEYLVDLLPVLFVAAASVTAIPEHSLRIDAKVRKAVVGGLAVVAVGLLCATFIGPQPLAIAVTGVQTTGQLGLIDEIHLNVQNRRTQPLSPHFTVMVGTGQVTTFWPADGPGVLKSKETAAYTLVAPNVEAMPYITGDFKVIGFTPVPGSMSTSGDFHLPRLVTLLTPRSVPQKVPVGHPIVFTVQLLSSSGEPIHQAGVPVTLNQVIYGPNYVAAATSSINGSPPGTPNVTEVTNAQGAAQFTVVNNAPQSSPTFYEADIPNAGQPFGYSNIVTLTFGP